MVMQELEITHHNRTVYGTFYRPDDKEIFPIIILSHGYNGHESDFANSAQYFAENGVEAICYTGAVWED